MLKKGPGSGADLPNRYQIHETKKSGKVKFRPGQIKIKSVIVNNENYIDRGLGKPYAYAEVKLGRLGISDVKTMANLD
jgi:hypothetical protein